MQRLKRVPDLYKRMLELWSIIFQSHKRKPAYTRVRPYVVYGLEFIIKFFESNRRENAGRPVKTFLAFLHRVFLVDRRAKRKKRHSTAIQLTSR